MVEETKLSYLAGIVDGEGSIGINTHRDKEGNHYSLSCRLTINNSNLDLINYCKNIIREIGIGERRIKIDTIQKKPNHKVVYRIFVNERNCILLILSHIEKYIISKREQAKIMIEYCSSNEPYHKKIHLYDKMIKLNKRGL